MNVGFAKCSEQKKPNWIEQCRKICIKGIWNVNMPFALMRGFTFESSHFN